MGETSAAKIDLSIDLGENGTYTFNKLGELTDWAEKEKTDWAWVGDFGLDENRKNDANWEFVRRFYQQIQKIDNRVMQLSTQVPDADEIRRLREARERPYREEHLIHPFIGRVI